MPDSDSFTLITSITTRLLEHIKGLQPDEALRASLCISAVARMPVIRAKLAEEAQRSEVPLEVMLTAAEWVLLLCGMGTAEVLVPLHKPELQATAYDVVSHHLEGSTKAQQEQVLAAAEEIIRAKVSRGRWTKEELDKALEKRDARHTDQAE